MSASVEGTCSSCGAPLSPAATYMAEAGSVCWPCFERLQSQQAQAVARETANEESLTRRARMLGGTHGIWALSAILATQWVPLPSWLSSVLIVASFALVYALAFRWRGAYLTALCLDAAGIVAVLAWGAARIVHAGNGIVLVLLVFPAAMLGLTRWLRGAYLEEPALTLRRSVAIRLWLIPTMVAGGVVATVGHVLLRPRPDPARLLMGTTLPAWQEARARPGSAPGGSRARLMLDEARPWPALARALDALDRAWPDAAPLRDAARGINRALNDAQLPYFVDVWPVGNQGIALSHEIVDRAVWRLGPRPIDLLRLRRLDTLNVEFGLLGATQEGSPVVLLDRIEAALAKALPPMFDQPGGPASPLLNDFDRAALAHDRAWLEAQLGPGLGRAAAALAERDRRLEEMRARLNGGKLQLDPPDGFVLGEAWLEKLEPEAALTRWGRAVVLEEDLRQVARADEQLRQPETARLLGTALDLVARGTEAHEARHAADEDDPVGPPPPALFEVMEGASTMMIGLADKELRAYLGEIHDAAAPACVSVGAIMRLVHGQVARGNPHHFATLAILRQLEAKGGAAPAEQLAALCALPDAELRQKAAGAWAKLYGAPMPAATRL